MTEGDQILLKKHLKELRFTTIQQILLETIRQSEAANSGYEQFLLALCEQELQQRHANQLVRRLKEAKFPQMKTLEKTDIKKWKSFDGTKIREYASGEYIKRQENLLLIGGHGTGKTHAAICLGIEACRQGYRTLFVTASSLVNSLVEARDEKCLKNMIAKLRKYSLLIIDELGYIPFSQEGAQLLFQVISERYEQNALIVTSNLAFSQWTQVFHDTNLTAALLDRLTHHGHIHQFDWDSIRLTDSLERTASKPN
jgi:DNA replication protein DnaC